MGLFAGVTLFKESFKLSLLSLRSHKLRTFLTLLGIIVGVTSVIAVMTIISGLDQTVSSAFSSQGSTAFSVSKRPLVITSREDLIKYNKRRDVTREDAEAIIRLCRNCWRVGMAVNGMGLVKHGENRSEGVSVRGLTLSMFDIENVVIQSGRLWTENEGNAGRNVCVIGTDIIENLFPGRTVDSVVGDEVRVDGIPFSILGVAAPFGKVLGFSRDNFVYVPFQSAQKMFGARDSITVHVQVSDSDVFETAKDEVRTIMRTRRGKSFGDEDDGVSIESQDAFIGIYQNATSGIYFATFGVAVVSLVVGGIVVMNIMLVSVTERTKEIGLRKAVGARQRDVMQQFLIEAVTVTVLGGAIGVVTGYGLAFLLSFLMGFPVLISIKSAVLGVTVSFVVGLISGLYPAWRASQLSPIDAMRNE
ncbi:MAG: ABC transporter permease [Acidobacteria bacterium]|nr:ABC transporter permease [Acidobacteriota bacterium]MBK8149204.1 ABC transporter permease [Acidobacteriota bacterium]MBK8811234.1 ABC transporter permease [Acidobacteriota bacterium]